ncbi:MAG: tRNA dihydrouridine synthase DusB [Treponema sp.]|nr:tRNA dihydrouridine synthase DusB [Treponema sp.]
MSLYRPVSIGSLSLPGNLFLAPVAGYSDRAFRSLCVDQGADFTYTELVSAEALVRLPADLNTSKSGALLRRGRGEARYAIQLFGANPEVMYRAVLRLAPFRPEAVDVNSGCPVPKVVKAGAGSALMRDPAVLGRVVEAAVRASAEALGGVPVTVKMRSGWDSAALNYREAAATCQEAGAALVTLHPRTRAQGYSGKSDWSHIADLASRLRIPVAGSGDLYTPEDAERMFRETGCAAVMFARGAIGNPFVFAAARARLTGGAYAPPLPGERLAAAFRHLLLLAEDLGERTACLEMRKQFCAYTKGGGPGIPRGNQLRERLVHAGAIADYRIILEEYGLGPQIRRISQAKICLNP